MAATPPYASVEDVRLTLGSIGSSSRLPAAIDLEAHLAAAHAEALDRLAETYTTGIPTFTGDGAEAVRWAEAKIAAAAVLELLRAQLGDDSLIPQRMRDGALATLDRGVPGFRPQDTPVDDDGDPATPPVVHASGPRISSAALSAFASPYGLDLYAPAASRVQPQSTVVSLPFGSNTDGYPDGTVFIFY